MAKARQFEGSRPKPTEDNVDAPLPGDRGSRGSFGGVARRRSIELWLRMHRGVLAAGAATAAGVALSGRALARR